MNVKLPIKVKFWLTFANAPHVSDDEMHKIMWWQGFDCIKCEPGIHIADAENQKNIPFWRKFLIFVKKVVKKWQH